MTELDHELSRAGRPTISQRHLHWLSLADVILLPALILWFIWKLQFTTRWTWVLFPAWLIASFFLHRDTPYTLGMRADNLWQATRQSLVVFGSFVVGLVVFGLVLASPRELPQHLASWHRLWSYFAFCLLQQVALNSLLHNRMLSLVHREWLAAGLTGAIFALCHWPNPVLVPLTFVGGSAMAWLFGRARNIIPLAIGQALIGSLAFWAFPIAWQHHLRVGPGYYSGWR